MIGWLVQEIMTFAATVASWFMAPASANFGLLQLTVSLLLIVLCIFLVIFWSDLVAFFKRQPRP